MGNLSKAVQKQIDRFRGYIVEELLPDICRLYPATGGTKTVSPSGIITSSAPVAKQWLNPKGVTVTSVTTVIGPTLDSYSVLGVVTTNKSRIAQSVVTSTTARIVSFMLTMDRAGAPGGLTITVRPNSTSNLPDYTVPALKTVTYTPHGNLDHTIPIGVDVEAGTYWIVLEVTAPVAGRYYMVFTKATNPYPSGRLAVDVGPITGSYLNVWNGASTLTDLYGSVQLILTTPGVLVSDIPCRLDASRAFRPEHMKFEVVTANEISLELPWDAPVVATDRVTVLNRLGETRKFEIRKITEGSNNDGTIVCLIEEITADFDHG